MHRAFLALLLTATPLGLLAATSGPATAATDVPTIEVSQATARLGKAVTVSGEGPALRRTILQMRTPENGWQAVATTTTGLSGNYSFRAPGWYGTHKLRILVPATLILAPAVSKTRTVTVKMPYPPRGRKSDWSWISHQGARWNPCRAITYRINPRQGYPAAMSDIRSTFRQVGKVTGFHFKYLGRTTRDVRRGQYDHHPAGTDVVVDWQSPGQDGDLSGGVAGLGGHWVLDGHRFNGYMVLDQTERFPRTTWRQLMTHEIGHIIGLGHARSPRQLMYGVATTKNRKWGAGDLTALRRVGTSRGCLAAPAARTTGGLSLPHHVSLRHETGH